MRLFSITDVTLIDLIWQLKIKGVHLTVFGVLSDLIVWILPYIEKVSIQKYIAMI